MKVGIDHIKKAIITSSSPRSTPTINATEALKNAGRRQEAEDAIRHAEEVPDPMVVPLRPLVPPPFR